MLFNFNPSTFLHQQDVVFPSITVCNLNQVEASELKKLNIYEDMENRQLLLNEFVFGRKGNLSQDHENTMKQFRLWFEQFNSFSQTTSQKCNDLFISINFQRNNYTWKNSKGVTGPLYYPTDFGVCCIFVPHLYFQPFELDNNTIEDLYHNLKAKALHGEQNGLDIVLDAEQFNYAYHQSNAAGFKVSLHHHSDKPMVQFSSDLIRPGTETQINLEPTISNTTEAAISKFTPLERNCYTSGEVNLTHLVYKDGFRYDMNNCIIDNGIKDMIWNCRCLPRIWDKCYSCGENSEYYNAIKTLPYCTGNSLYCANMRMKTLGLEEIPEEYNITVPKALENTEKIGNVSQPKSITCLPGCTLQENNKKMSYAPYPQKNIFFYQKTFCDAASHILDVSCYDYNDNYNRDRRFLIDESYPNLCKTLEEHYLYFQDCNNWPGTFEPNQTLIDEMYNYGRENLAMVHVMIQSPYITKIKRDVSITFTNYMANTGGLLGLCIGFSFISAFEILFCFCSCCMKPKKTAVEKIAPVEKSYNSLTTQTMFELQKPAIDSSLPVPVYQTP